MSGRSGSSPAGPLAREPVLENGVDKQLQASGDKERLKALLRDRLVECGWREDVVRHAREFMAKAGGRDKVTADQIVAAVKPRGRQRVPDHVKAELLTALRASILDQ